MRRSPPSFLLFALLIASLAFLAACRNPVTPDPDPTPDPVDPADPPVSNPTPPVTHEVGMYAISGLETIPTDMIQVTNKEMQNLWAIIDYDIDHLWHVSYIACHSYLVHSPECETTEDIGPIRTRNEDGTVTSQTGIAPFTGLLDFKFLDYQKDTWDNSWLEQEMREMGTKIAVYPNANIDDQFLVDGLPWLILRSAGNDWTDILNRDFEGLSEQRKERISDAIAANKLMYVAGWDKDKNGNYIRAESATGCKVSEDRFDGGCIWARYVFENHYGNMKGTSLSAPNFAAALASVLAVFPDTSPQDLAKFSKSCAKKSGEGIEALLRQSGGVGVADFNCMGGVIDALTSLPAGGVTNVTINGQKVAVGGRKLSLGFAGDGLYRNLLWRGTEENDTIVNFTPTGDDTGLMSLTRLEGDWFASTAFGIRDDFFGYSYGHDEVREWRLTSGHRNLFATLSKQSSAGSDFIDSAAGRALSLTVQQYLSLTDNTHAVVSAVANKFLGGKANIPVGNIKLNGGGWNQRISVDTKTALGRNAAFSASATYHSPEHGEDGYTLSAGLHWRF